MDGRRTTELPFLGLRGGKPERKYYWRRRAMWQTVVGDGEGRLPCARSKHAVCLLNTSIYVLGGRNGNLPLRDFWRLDLDSGQWEELRGEGSRPLNLQEHTMVGWQERLYVFGGEVGFSSGAQTPLWCYDTKTDIWTKLSTPAGAAGSRGQRPTMTAAQRSPKGLRGHSAVVHGDSMYLYGGYRDLKGSTAELWRYDFETGAWQELRTGAGPTEGRHDHSAVVHDSAMWVYGGMTDLTERSDLWRLDLATETWERVPTTEPQPAPRSQSAAVAVSALLLPAERRRLQRPLSRTAPGGTTHPTESGRPVVPVVHADVLYAKRRVQVRPAETVDEAGEERVGENEERARLTQSGSGRPGAGGAWPRVHASGSQLLWRISQVNLAVRQQPGYSALSNGSTDSVEMQPLGQSAAGAGQGDMTKSFSTYAMPPVDTTSDCGGFPRDHVSFPDLLGDAVSPAGHGESRVIRHPGQCPPMPTGNRSPRLTTRGCSGVSSRSGLSTSSAARLICTTHGADDVTSDYSSIEHCDITGYDNPNYVGYRAAARRAHDELEMAPLSRSRDSGISERRRSPSSSPVLDECDQTLMPYYPVYMYTLGGQESSSITRFKRPLSVWRFQLA
ncbi:Leucine-zipper-like transcriptional regulator 1 [Amphibalanus amphitrite]|uniref:Leucine-zipper-like transcriptional regulator 1 n=1 Tax=Amphibalanus amphitrite TaxID=1232801 RepID=A0A6A4VF25_AMPAM|nr:Leucine-zipper-like transcriptional regulator 1 [Amphibalanus amphitrite]